MFHLFIETENAAFRDVPAGAEVARILRRIATKMEEAGTRYVDGAPMDANGNSCGAFLFDVDDGRRPVLLSAKQRHYLADAIDTHRGYDDHRKPERMLSPVERDRLLQKMGGRQP